MGGSIARGLAKGTIIPASDIIVSNPTQGKLDALKAEFPALQTTRDNQEALSQVYFPSHYNSRVRPPAQMQLRFPFHLPTWQTRR